MKTRMQAYFERSRAVAKNPPESTFDYDTHYAAKELYSNLPSWEKRARSVAYAVVNQKIYIEQDDRIIGRTYYRERRVEEPDLDFWDRSRFLREYAQAHPDYGELQHYQQATWGGPGHIAWDWNYMLRHGTTGIRERCMREMPRKAGDERALEFYNGVLIMLDAIEEWNDKHADELEKMGKSEEAEIVRRVPRYPARTFREAVQAFFMQHIVVMKEDPYGGNSPGRMDYYLWPYLESDLKEGRITLEEAEELVEELLIRIDERLHLMDMWGESAVIGGCHQNRTTAVNPLSYMMIRGHMKYDITHPYLYMRLSSSSPKEFVELAADYVINGQNRAQILNDDAIIKALVKNGVSDDDAVNYFCGGCMEVGVQGKTGDFLFAGYHNVLKLLELCVTGGYCLVEKKQLEYFKAKPLTEFSSFEDFYSAFIEKADEVLTQNLEFIDRLSEYNEATRPTYLISSMIDDCIARGRGLDSGGVRYNDYGAAFVGLPNAADALIAIKKAVFEDKICSAEELIAALRENFEGYETLRARLLKLPKYGQENDEADEMAAKLSLAFSKIYSSYINRFGGNGKLVMLSFTYSVSGGKLAGASADGRLAGVPLAQSVTPQGAAMTKGITAAMNSCTRLPFDCFSGAASTMWDLDSQWATNELVSALITSFFEKGGHIFQGNVTDVETLIKAQKSPEEYENLIVRVGGFSARFITLRKDLQDDVINRMRHKC